MVGMRRYNTSVFWVVAFEGLNMNWQRADTVRSDWTYIQRSVVVSQVKAVKRTIKHAI